MVIHIKKIILILLLFIFNISYIDSNNIKSTFYNYNDLDNNEYHTIYFKNISTIELRNIIDDKNILSYIIDGKKYYYSSIDKLEEDLLNDNIKIDGITLLCTPNDILNIKEKIDIY